ncbi:MAG: pyridoxamine 5'-phosphate oxidase family protein [Thaumarchaeota archaeon]|nr:pyridoxamine 5'-phosphate oxidase family protein [Nitrososphaerota archaeon]
MVEITEEVVRLIMKEGYVVLVSTVDEKGVPNVSPRFVLDIIGKKELLFADAFRDRTFSNIRKWPKVSVAVLDRKSLSGFQLKGQAEKVTSKRLVDQAGARPEPAAGEEGIMSAAQGCAGRTDIYPLTSLLGFELFHQFCLEVYYLHKVASANYPNQVTILQHG